VVSESHEWDKKIEFRDVRGGNLPEFGAKKLNPKLAWMRLWV
jgi:hypothetical protein